MIYNSRFTSKSQGTKHYGFECLDPRKRVDLYEWVARGCEI